MNCKILDQGNEAVHFGASLGGGVHVVRDDENGTITVCRHPAGDVQAAPDVVITRDSAEWSKAFNDADRVPEHRAVTEERERKPAERKAEREEKWRAEQAAREARLQAEQAERDAKTEKDKK